MRQPVRPGRDGNGLLYPTLCLVAGKRQICCKPTFNVYCVRPQHIWRRSTVFEFLFRGRIIPVVLVADIMCLLCATTREASRVKVYCMLQLSYWPLAGMCGCGEVISFLRKAGGGNHYFYWMLCHGPGLVSIGSTSVETRNVYCRRQRSKFCIERYSGCVVSTICDTLCFVIKTQTKLSGHTEVPVFCVDYSRPAGKEGGGVTCIPERKSYNSKETATCTESDRFPDFCLT